MISLYKHDNRFHMDLPNIMLKIILLLLLSQNVFKLNSWNFVIQSCKLFMNSINESNNVISISFISRSMTFFLHFHLSKWSSKKCSLQKKSEITITFSSLLRLLKEKVDKSFVSIFLFKNWTLTLSWPRWIYNWSEYSIENRDFYILINSKKEANHCFSLSESKIQTV